MRNRKPKPRGRWMTSIADRGKAKYQADQIAAANDEMRQQAWQDGYDAGFKAGRDSVLSPPEQRGSR